MKSSLHLAASALLLLAGAVTGFAASNSEQLSTNLVDLSKTAPDHVVVGETYVVKMVLTAKRATGKVVVTDRVPQGAKLVKTVPEAAVNGNQIVWTIDSMGDGDVETLETHLSAQGEGEFTSCATLSVTPRACVSTIVGKPELKIVKTGPATALLGSQVTYNIVVSNTGNALARNVVLTDEVPAGMSHVSGSKKIQHVIGDLAAGAQKEIAVTLGADTRGKHCNKAVAASDNAGQVNDEACTTVLKQELDIAKTGTELQFLGKVATYQIVVRNLGDTPLTNVVVTDQAPAGTQITDAPGATVTGNTAVWQVAQLGAGATKNLTLKLTSRQAGNLCNNVSVATTEGLSDNSQACTEWKGHPALLLEVIDTVDPLLPGEKTQYKIRVTNQGTALDRQVAIKAMYPGEVKPLAVSGSTPGTVKGQVVTVTPRGVLNAGEFIEWLVDAEAVKAGDSRLKVEMTSELIKTPVTEEESTHVY